ncbi:MAG: hypothetical protein P1U68_15455 [Verrucomicrobiales bacterium]|nr:hypothetical protein [Verrucomicrobiales bacterium]
MNTNGIIIVMLVFVCITGCSEDAVSQGGSGNAVPAPLTVIDLPENLDSPRNRNVPVTFHLPASEEPQPLVLVSHGASGTRDGLYALAAELAREGYVVMCLEHVTSNLDNIRNRMRTKGLGFKDALIDSGTDIIPRRNRPLDVSFGIDLAERMNSGEERLKGRIDLSRIALIGHSYGAYTTMVCCGVKPVDIEGDLKEPRIRLGIALSPQSASGVFFDEDSFPEVTCPFVGISGTGDNTFDLASAWERKDFFDLMPGADKHFLWLHDAGHFSFSDPSGSARKLMIPPDRDVTRVLKTVVPAFLGTYLRGEAPLDKSARDELVERSLGGKVRKIDWMAR